MNMSKKFVQVGINLQYDSIDKKQALNRFKHSCYLCASQGKHIECNNCRIKDVHELIIALFDDIATEKKNQSI